MGLGNYHVSLLLLSGAVLVYLSFTSVTLFHDYWALLLHIGAVGTWLGTSIWVTFFSGLLLFKHLPRAQFGEVQSYIFPWYFGFSFLLSSLALATWLQLRGPTLSSTPVRVLGVASILSALQLALIGPIVTNAMRERHRAEKDADQSKSEAAQAAFAKARKRFGALHGLSSLANLLIVLAAVAQTWTLSTQLTLLPTK